MTIQKLPGSAITPGTITVTQLESSVATTVQTGGGPKLTNIQVTDNTYTVLDDTAVDVTGGYIKITGTGFVTGCSVIVGQLAAASVTFISSTEVRAQLSAQSAGTYIVYLVNPDGGVGIRVNGVTHSASPAWQTASGLPDQYDGVAINLSLVATDATSYTITSGSLPPGLSLNGNTGVISGTVSGVANDTLYTFTVRATDAQLQDSPRTFTVTITVSDPYFKLTTLLLSGSAISANTVVRDSSTNNFNLTVYGDARASNFTPYGTGWSVYFDGTGDYLTIPNSVGLAFGTGDFTVEFWAYVPTSEQSNLLPILDNDYNSAGGIAFCIRKSDNLLSLGPQASGQGLNYCGFTANFALETWNHFVVVAHNSVYKAFLNGTQLSTQFGSTVVQNVSRSSGNIEIGRLMGQTSFDFGGYLSNFRVIKGTALYTANFTPATTNLTSVANTSLLTCHVNRFMDGSTNNFAITRNGDAKIVSFNPFNITNTGVNGSMYFDETGDYIAWSPATTIQFGTGDFTVEAWIYPTSSSVVSSGCYIIDARNSGQTTAWALHTYTSYTWFNGTSTVTGGAPIINQWTHLVYVRSGTTGSMFVNGARVASQTDSTNYSVMPTTSYIGTRFNQTQYWPGYISNIRIIKGTAAYDPTLTTLTVPTAPLTAIANTQLLTLQYDQPHNNHTFLDSSSNQFLVTRSGNATQGTFSPFSPVGWSTYLYDGVIQASMGTNGQFGTGDFTVDIWINPIPGSITTSSGNVVWSFALYPAGIYIVHVNDGTVKVVSGGVIVITSAASAAPLYTWSHIAVSRASTALRLFVNGSQIGPAYTDSSNYTQGFYGIGRPDDVASYYYRGYLSNFRVVKGTALYTANFTPSTSSLTAVTNTQLLILQSNRYKDNSTNNYAITVSGTYSIQAFSPFAPTAIYSPAVHGGSAYFDGTGDYLGLPTSQQIVSATGDLTIECFVYPTSLSSDIPVYTQTNGGASSGRLNLAVFTSGALYFQIGGSGYTGTSGVVKSNQWNFISATRTGSSVSFYVNGASAGSGTVTGTIDTGSSIVSINRGADGTASTIPLYYGSFRISNSVRSNLTNIPTAPYTSDTNTTLLLNFTDAAILDSTGRNVLETVADAKTSSVVTKFTGGSMYFDGTGDYLVVPSSVLHLFGALAFTVEAWVYTTTTKQYQHIYGTHNADTNWIVRLLDNKIMMYTGSADITGVTVLATNTWYHVAAVREGTGTNQTKLYVNGTLDVTGTNATNYTTQSQAWIGAQINAPSITYFQGYIADLRVTRGYARYTANFIAPTAPARLK